MQGYARVLQGYARVCRGMQEYAGACKSMQGYAKIVKSMHKYARVCIQNKGPKAFLRNARVTMLRSTTIWSRGLKYTMIGVV